MAPAKPGSSNIGGMEDLLAEFEKERIESESEFEKQEPIVTFNSVAEIN